MDPQERKVGEEGEKEKEEITPLRAKASGQTQKNDKGQDGPYIAAGLQERRKTTDSIISYNPYEHREVLKPNSDMGSLAHMLKTSLGSGILAMPMAYKNAGLVGGVIGTIFIGLICTHCIQMLVRSSYIQCKRTRVPTLGYSETAKTAFQTGPTPLRKMAKTVSIIITCELLLSFIMGNSVYVLSMASAISQVVEFYVQPHIDLRLYILMLWLPLILMCFFRTLKSLVPFSVIANIMVFISFVITLYYIFRSVKSPGEAKLITTVDEWPLFLTTVIFSIEGIGTILPIENEMKHPEHFVGGRCGLVYISMTIVIIVYGVVGFFGYLEYRDETRGNITLNLPVEETLAQSVKVLIGTAIFFTYALQFYVPINIIYDLLKPFVSHPWEGVLNYSVRIGLVSLTIILSIVVPKLEVVISLVGAICFSMLGLLFPAVIDIVTRWPALGCCKWLLIKDILIILISAAILFCGTYATFVE